MRYLPDKIPEDEQEIKKTIEELSKLSDFELNAKSGDLYENQWENIKDKLLNQIDLMNVSYKNKILPLLEEIKVYSEELEEIIIFIKKHQRKMFSLDHQKSKIADEWLDLSHKLDYLWSEIEHSYDGHSYDESLLEERNLKIRKKDDMYEEMMSFSPRIDEESKKCLEYSDKGIELRKKRGQTIFKIKELLSEVYEI